MINIHYITRSWKNKENSGCGRVAPGGPRPAHHGTANWAAPWLSKRLDHVLGICRSLGDQHDIGEGRFLYEKMMVFHMEVS